MSEQKQYRILVIDDNRAIHQDFNKILMPDNDLAALDDIENELFENNLSDSSTVKFEVDSAYQGKEGFEKILQANNDNNPYSMAFVDIRMPPGWDGIETIERIWEKDPDFQIVICSAYSDHSWSEISQRLGNSSQLLILKKPFENIEIIQMAHAMSQKCTLQRLEKRLVAIDSSMDEYKQAHDEHNEELQNNKKELNELKSRFEVFEDLVQHFDNNYSIPLQDIKDSTELIQNSFKDIDHLVQEYHEAYESMDDSAASQLNGRIKKAEEDTDISNIRERVPAAYNKLTGALDRLSEHIKAIQELAESARLKTN